MVRLTRLVPDGPRRRALSASSRPSTPAARSRTASASRCSTRPSARAASSPAARRSSRRRRATPGIALAFCCAAKGYDLAIFLPQGMSREREALLRLYGARVEVVESLGGMSEAVDAARALAARPRRLPARPVLQPGQPGGAPPRHRPGDPRRARRQGRRLRRRRRHGRHDHRGGGGDQGAQPQGPGRRRRAAVLARCSRAGRPGPHRIQGIGAGFVPAVLDREVLDEVHRVLGRGRDRRRARGRGARGHPGRDLVRRRAVGRARRSPRVRSRAGKRIVTVLPDSGERYISAPFFAPNGR